MPCFWSRRGLPNDALYTDLMVRKAKWADSGIESVKAIGDAQAPAAIAWATYAGHRYAEEFDMPDPVMRCHSNAKLRRLKRLRCAN